MQTGCKAIKCFFQTTNVLHKSFKKYIILQRVFSNSATQSTDWWEIYHRQKKKLEESFKDPVQINPHAIFANNETSLSEIDIYGFDYDYTLACYKPELHHLIFELGREALIQKYRYPDQLVNIEYCPDFAVRGCHYDVKKGLLLKLDSFHNIQLGTVYRGTKGLSDEAVKTLYGGIHVSLEDMNTFYGTGPMYQLVDLFAPPEMTLLCNITDFFMENGIPYDPEYVFHDVRSAVQSVHNSGQLHSQIMADLETYLDKETGINLLLETLVNKGKQLFLITNSGFPFVDAGMKFMVGDNWRDLFQVIITKARKPKFFNESKRPFRIYDPETQNESYDRVLELSKGKIYQQGNYYMLQSMTGWYGFNVLYFGDHVYSDLADPSLKHGWRTGAIIPELEAEIIKSNNLEYQLAVKWLCTLQDLIENAQMDRTQDTSQIRQCWLDERKKIRNYTKSLFNAQFGSIFRTYHNPTYFSRRLARFADLYMSNVVNLLHYPIDHTFYPRRMELPHEPHVVPREIKGEKQC
ncbi:5'-nucleotidase domain-containing protein 3-like [Saccostrea echinata]|uniref:5'-nucleotidase domain-containing protein 3-like n=1 Tax=Saccostrea echinata TaxID=191078 RepID=UPI002A840E37|nr:5'-nucleotidase domain-containing protein 3-like [Saccostrea echinata]